jgi:hypothetical protein
LTSAAPGTAENANDVGSDATEFVQILPEEGDGQVRPHAGNRFLYAEFDRPRVAENVAGHLPL